MAKKRTKVRVGTAAEATAANVYLEAGEIGVESDTIETEVGMKMGPGYWNDLPYFVFGSGGSGTVTSVDMTVPSIMSIGGNPITTSGTLALSFDDAGADKLMLWDDTDNDVVYVTIGSGLSYDHSSHTLTASASVTPAALTKTDDTNVTLTLGGTPATALLQATSLTLGWTGQLAASRGGTGIGSYTIGDILYASGASALSKLNIAPSNNVLRAPTASVAPEWGKVTEDYQSLSDVTTLDVSITKHGYTPKAPNDTTKFLRGDATWAVPTGSSVRLDQILAATATNSIDSTNYAQTWAWSTASTQTPFTWTANALSTGTLFTLSSTSTAGDASKLLQLTRSGANAGSSKTNYGLYSAITNTGTSSTNVAGYFTASGASNNYGLIVDAGSVGIGTTAPSYKLHIRQASSGTTPIAANPLLLENAGDVNIVLLNRTGDAGGVLFANGTSTYNGAIQYNVVSNAMTFRTNGTTTRMIIGSNGYLGVGNWATDPTYDIDVKGSIMRFTTGLATEVYYGYSSTLGAQLIGNGIVNLPILMRIGTSNMFRLTTQLNYIFGSGTSEPSSGSKILVIESGGASTSNVTDAVQIYSSDVAPGQASPFFRTEDGGIFQIGTAKTGWNSNTNLVLVSNNTTVLTLKTDTTAEFASDVTINGKLTVTGAIDPTHLYLDEQSGNPSNVANKGILYTKDVSGTTQLFYMDSAGGVNQVTPTSGTGTVTSIATAGLISGGTITTTGTITTSMATGKLVGRSTAGTGVMEEITVGSGLSLSGGTLTATGGGSGDFVLITTGTASSSATIDFTGLDSTYSCYKIILNGVIPATNGAGFWIRVGTGGTPTYQSGASDYAWVSNLMYVGGTGTTVSTANTGDGSDAQISMASGAPGNGTGSNICGEITVYKPSQTSTYHMIEFRLVLRDAAGSPDQMIIIGSGSYLSTTAVTAIRFMFSSGNISSGEFKLYGIT